MTEQPTPGSATRPLHLGIALNGAGWHSAARQIDGVARAAVLTADYWLAQVAKAESGLLDLVTLEDSLRGGADSGLDAVLIASRIAPATRHIGLVPTGVVTHTEPFHLSKAIATLDYVSTGRAGLRVQVDASVEANRHFGRRLLPESVHDLFDEAADYVEAVRRLWDSWEDDAEIRDAATGRFIDRDKVHYIDFESRFFTVKGPSITPRPPQGQPVVAALAHAEIPFGLVAESTDLGFVTPHSVEQTRSLVNLITTLRAGSVRSEEPLHLWGDLVVVLGEDDAEAEARLDALNSAAGEEFASDAYLFTGAVAELADLLENWQLAGLTGFRLRPASNARDIPLIVDQLVPELQRRGLFRTAYEATTLRGLLSLGRPANRYESTPIGGTR